MCLNLPLDERDPPSNPILVRPAFSFMISSFSHSARWIWSAAATRPYHNIVLFRRALDVVGDATDARLLITADSRYEVFVNGEWLGHGPARSWPSPWPVDPYDLRGRLRPGRNVVAVRVQHFGIGTFQYLSAEPGLIAELSWTDTSGRHALVTDAGWRARPEAAFLWPVPRISCQLPWEEQFDARLAERDWAEPGHDDGDWPTTTVSHAAGEGPHRAFETRNIPQLTREAVAPVRVRAVEVVRGASFTWTLNPREFLNHEDKSANFLRGRMLLATHIYSEHAQKIDFHPPHHRPRIAWTLNGRPLRFDDHSLQRTDTGVAHARLKVGWNTLMGPLPSEEHFWWAVLNVWTEHPVRWSAYPDYRDTSTPWLAAGPFGDDEHPQPPAPVGIHKVMTDASETPVGATVARFETLLARGRLDDSELAETWVRPLTRDMVAEVDVYALCASERVIPRLRPKTENLDALLHDTSDWATIHPVAGADVRVLLDFGREIVGYHEFEIDAPAGTIVDNHNFEFIQPDGRYNLTEGMNNSFRYVCREGAQRYRTLVRRGFVYSWLSFRNFDRPVRVRFVRALESTYPQVRQGAFACSDAWLDRIWEAGAHSVKCCSEDTYTDCPTYEQTFWVGDARNEALVDLVANGDPRLSAHGLEIAARSLGRSDLVESQVPSAWENLLPAWSFLWMRWTQEHYRLTGDVALARRMVKALARNVAGIERHLSERGLFRIKAWNMFDWAALDTPSGGEITHLNALAVLGLRQATELAADVGARKEAGAWTALANRITAAINRHLWDDKKKAFIDCIRPDGTRSPVFSQQTHTAVYIAGAASGARLTRSREIMAKAPKGFVEAGSPFFMFFVLEGLAREGRIDEMVRSIRNYWGNQVEAGATTFWETYHPTRARMTRSHCHGWSAAPTYFISQYVLGVRPAGAGYTEVRIAPHPAGLAWARGRVPTPRGTVEVAWTHDAKAKVFELRVESPIGMPVKIQLPLTGKPIVLEGRARVTPGKRGAPAHLRTNGGHVRVRVGGSESGQTAKAESIPLAGAVPG